MPRSTFNRAGLAAALFAAGCAPSSPPGQAPVVAPAPTAVATVARPAVPRPARVTVSAPAAATAMLADYLAAWNGHDIERVAGFFTDDARYFDASTGSVQMGRAAIESGIVSVLIRAVPDLRREVRGEPIVQGDAIAFEWTLTGTNTGTWNGVPATHQKLRLGGVTVMRLHDGRIASQADYYDVSALNRQMGWQ